MTHVLPMFQRHSIGVCPGIAGDARREHDPEKWKPVFRKDHAQKQEVAPRVPGNADMDEVLRAKRQQTASAMRAITIRGAREHNLKNIDVEIPRDRLRVFTGLSGSGKSSLALATIHAERQRRSAHSRADYARPFLERMQEPDVRQSPGLAPAVSPEPKP